MPSPPLPCAQVLHVANRFATLEVEDAGAYVDASEGERRAPARGVPLQEDPRLYPRRRLKPFGSVDGHARFLQHIFRRSRAQRPGCWRAGGMAGMVWWRLQTTFDCHDGLTLASSERVAAQRARGAAVLGWYQNYVRLHRKWHSRKTPTALVTFWPLGCLVPCRLRLQRRLCRCCDVCRSWSLLT